MKNPTNGTIKMRGQEIKILFGADCVTSLSPSEAKNLPEITAMLCRTLQRKSVANFLQESIKPGESFALLDKASGYTFRVEFGKTAILVVELYAQPTPPTDPEIKTMILLNHNLIWLVQNQTTKAVAA